MKNNPFQLFAEKYDSWFESHQNIYQSELNAIMEFIKDGKNGIEIGAGTGRFSIPLNVPIGIEPSGKMAEIAGLKGMQIVNAKAENLPFDGELFDFTLFVTTICFLQNIDESFKEAHRITKKSGFIVVAFIDKNSEIGHYYQNKRKESRFYKNARFYSVKQVIKHLEKAGFNDFFYLQTLNEMNNAFVQPVEEGYGKGGFIVIKGNKAQI